MKPRLITTKKLLVGLAIAAVGAGPGPAQASTSRPQRDAAGYPLVGNLIRKANPGPPGPPPDSEASPALLELRGQLVQETRKTAFARMKRYRPICDAAGYPLVGNVMRKGEPDVQPSTFCLEVRKAEAPKS